MPSCPGFSQETGTRCQKRRGGVDDSRPSSSRDGGRAGCRPRVNDAFTAQDACGQSVGRMPTDTLGNELHRSARSPMARRRSGPQDAASAALGWTLRSPSSVSRVVRPLAISNAIRSAPREPTRSREFPPGDQHTPPTRAIWRPLRKSDGRVLSSRWNRTPRARACAEITPGRVFSRVLTTLSSNGPPIQSTSERWSASLPGMAYV